MGIGKIIGGILGLLSGGPIGAVIGLFCGHIFDKAIAQFHQSEAPQLDV